MEPPQKAAPRSSGPVRLGDVSAVELVAFPMPPKCEISYYDNRGIAPDEWASEMNHPEQPDSSESTAGHDVAGRRKAPVVNDVRLIRARDIEINSLTIDETFDGGADPYNSTGKHCVLKFEE